MSRRFSYYRKKSDILAVAVMKREMMGGCFAAPGGLSTQELTIIGKNRCHKLENYVKFSELDLLTCDFGNTAISEILLTLNRWRKGLDSIHLDNRNDSNSDIDIRSSSNAGGRWHMIVFLPKMFLRIIAFRYSETVLAESHQELKLKYEALRCLIKLFSLALLSVELLENICVHDDYLDTLFNLIRYEKTCLAATEFLEDLCLRFNNTIIQQFFTLDKHTILLRSLIGRPLACLCRLFESFLNPVHKGSQLLYQQALQSTALCTKLCKRNQEVLASSTSFLQHAVDIILDIKDGNLLQKCPENTQNERDVVIWLQWCDKLMTNIASDGGEEDFDMTVRFAEDINLRAVIIGVLITLLEGKFRSRVQRQLADFTLLPKISNVLDCLMWRFETGLDYDDYSVNAEFGCPFYVVKLYLLNLTHTFCDRSEYRYTMLNKSELQEVRYYNSASASIEDRALIPNMNESLLCTGQQGLLIKMIALLADGMVRPNYKAVLCRAIDSFVRGTYRFADQLFLLHHYTAPTVVFSLLYGSEHIIQEYRQALMDLLGEMAKYNYIVWNDYNNLLFSYKVVMFMRLVERKLVDSNVFVRSVWLTVEHYRLRNQSHLLLDNVIVQKIEDSIWKQKYLAMLLNSVEVTTVTQQNVSCLNTLLVLFIFTKRRGEGGLIEMLQALPGRTNHTCNGRKCSYEIQNFYRLLKFWQLQYEHPNCSRSGLVRDTRIPYDEWIALLETLLSTSGRPSSVAYYLCDAELSSIPPMNV